MEAQITQSNPDRDPLPRVDWINSMSPLGMLVSWCIGAWVGCAAIVINDGVFELGAIGFIAAAPIMLVFLNFLQMFFPLGAQLLLIVMVHRMGFRGDNGNWIVAVVLGIFCAALNISVLAIGGLLAPDSIVWGNNPELAMDFMPAIICGGAAGGLTYLYLVRRRLKNLSEEGRSAS